MERKSIWSSLPLLLKCWINKGKNRRGENVAMVTVITYGTYDLLHYGHIRLLERAKALGDYLIVGVTADDFDKTRGKINVQQSLMERIEGIRATGLADKIIVEEYEGQKIDDIRRYDVDIFTVGSDWVGKFDYLNEYCKVIYLPRTDGISSSEVRSEQRKLKMGIIGDVAFRAKFVAESKHVNGVEVTAICSSQKRNGPEFDGLFYTSNYEELLEKIDSVYVVSKPENHYVDTKKALLNGKHVLCESPIALCEKECKELYAIAKEKGLVLMDAIKTAYSTAYDRLVLLAKSGKIGKVVSVDAVCTSLRDEISVVGTDLTQKWNSMCFWGPTTLLPVFQILGTDYRKKIITTKFLDKAINMDAFTKIDFTYDDSVASIKIAKAAKSEGELIVTGTNGYIYVPAPWWKTDYFEVRFENQENNQRFFYQLDGEGIRYEIVTFAKYIESKKDMDCVGQRLSKAIARIIQDFNDRTDLIEIGG